MITVTLDSNVYDKIDASESTKNNIKRLVDEGKIAIHAPEHVIHELKKSPFGGLPDWFRVETVRDSVFVAGITPYGNGTLGSGRIYHDHLGESKKYSDAIIADTANSSTDMLVTEDGRFKRKLAKASNECKVLDFAEFENFLRGLVMSKEEI